MSRFRRLLAALLIASLTTGAVTVAATSVAGCSQADASVLFTTSTGAGLTVSGLTFGPQPITVSGWIRPASTPTANSGFLNIADTVTTGDSGGFIYFAASTALSVGTPSTHFSLCTTAVSSWYFVAFTVAGTTWTGYCSPANGGTLSTANVTDATAPTKYTALWIGSEEGSPPFKGNVYAAKFWSAALTSAELQNEEFTARPIRTANLFAWYPLYQQSDEKIDYSTSSGHTLTEPATKPTTDTNPPIAWQ